jgi:hypothetical protein
MLSRRQPDIAAQGPESGIRISDTLDKFTLT